MAHLSPPLPPTLVALSDDDRIHRIRFRLWQLLVTAATVLATGWICWLGVPWLSITALAVAKHILVAIYVMGLHVYPTQEGQSGP